MTQREAILRQVLDLLNTGRPSDVPVAERLRFIEIEKEDLPALVLAPMQERVTRAGSARSVVVERTLRIRASVWATGTTDVGPPAISCDAAADVILAWLTKTLGGLAVPGLITSIDETSLQWDYLGLEQPVARVAVEFEVTYQTRVNDAEQRA